MVLCLFRWISRLFIISVIGFFSTVYMHNAKADEMLPIKVQLRDGQYKTVQVTALNLTEAQTQQLTANIEFALSPRHQLLTTTHDQPSKIELGMNNLPVLDQGQWGACATFATTAGIDAQLKLTGKDSISQLCNLQLGRTLQNPDSLGGWQGSQNENVLQQITQYGYLTLDYQQNYGCGGLKSYPLSDAADIGSAMSVSRFTQHSNKQVLKQNWQVIEPMGASLQPQDPTVGAAALLKVKQALQNNHHILIGAVLDIADHTPGAIGNYHGVVRDTWLLTDEILRDVKFNRKNRGGHALIITGYDDNACATYFDDKTKDAKQCGLLHLRNSWSNLAGDQGDYYMSYMYFDAMVLESVELQ